MLATLVDEAFDGEDWIFEMKWDGYRAIGAKVKSHTSLYSRNNISFADKFSAVEKAIGSLAHDVVLDGEIVALDESGNSRFQFLQNWQSRPEGVLAYYVFDVLWVDGHDVTRLPLIERKKILQQVIPEHEVIRYSDHISGNGKEFFEIVQKKGLEGIIAKQKNSTYDVDVRSRNWLKVKTSLRQEAVICGFTAPRASRQYFGALILGIYKEGELTYAGHTGTGFDQNSLKDTWKKLQPLITEHCPFTKRPKTNTPPTWVKPKLLCEVKFQEWTSENIMRVPVFLGLRNDKEPVEVKKEKAMATKKLQKTKPVSKAPSTRATKKKSSKTQQDELVKSGEESISVQLNGNTLKLTHLDKVYWKKEGYTKSDLINYYHGIASFILPYMKNKPQSLNRHPNGIAGMSFYQKNVQGKVPDWIETFEEFSESTGETVHYFVCTNEASLIYLANLGCIEMNPWHSSTKKPDNPDYCLIDLDPHEISFDKVIETAHTVKKVLDGLKIPSYCKTSGATGLHICIPLGAKYSYDQSRQLAELLVNLVHQEIPAFTSLERSPAKRRRKVYLDYLQNSKGQTVACVYSARPKPGASVSTPLYWEEVKSGLSPTDFTIKNVIQRVMTEGDLFKPVYEKGIDMKKTLATIESALQ